MKPIFFLSFFLSIGILTQAQTIDRKWAVGFWGGVYYGNELDGSGLMPELYFSRYLNSSFDVMLVSDLGIINSKVENTVDMGALFLNLRYKFNNGYILKQNSLVQPFLYAGPGLIGDNRTSGFNYDAGVGLKFAITPGLAVFVEGGYISGLSKNKAEENNTFSESFWKGIAGIEICFGKAPDSDLDGVSDNKDECPDTPAGIIVDEKGCPIDTDGDGVADYQDDCPDEPGNKLFNGCPDSDGDGIPDKIDECPGTAGLEKFNGCPDTDGDGIPDKKDECPDIPGFKEFNGCPDTDGDGVIDSKDQCPGTPEGYKTDDKGCPLDTDGDGIVDEEDDCPELAGTISNKGCPVAKEHIEKFNWVAKNILFNTNSSIIKKESYPAIQEAVKVLKENKLYRLNIEGHTDNVGEAKYNLWLSDRRANSIKKYIVSQGIEENRLDAKGYGEQKPIDTNETEQGRTNNRRVVLKLHTN